MKGKVCACIGQKPSSLPFCFDETDERCVRLKEFLRKNTESLIREEGVVHFISDMTLGANTYFAETVLELRDEKYPDITFEAAIPYETQAENWSESQRDRYYSAVSRCDTETLLQTVYTEDCMRRCDMYMIDRCDYLIAIWDGSHDSVGVAVRYAGKSGKNIIQTDPRFLESEREEGIYA